jgi:hypothetical protein
MLKKALLAAAATGLVAGISLPVQAATTAEQGMTTVQPGMSCKEAAKLQYPSDRSARRAFKKSCKEAWKAQGTAATATQ